MKRFLPAIAMNLLVPGTGLIVLGREWLGFGLTVAFGVTGELAAVGGLLAPASLPDFVTILAFGLVCIIWLVAQFFLFTRIRFLRDPRLPGDLAALCETAETAIRHNDPESAWHALRLALAMDCADLRSRVLWAQLLTSLGQQKLALRAWRQAARLDRSQQFAAEIRQGIAEIKIS